MKEKEKKYILLLFTLFAFVALLGVQGEWIITRLKKSVNEYNPNIKIHFMSETEVIENMLRGVRYGCRVGRRKEDLESRFFHSYINENSDFPDYRLYYGLTHPANINRSIVFQVYVHYDAENKVDNCTVYTIDKPWAEVSKGLNVLSYFTQQKGQTNLLDKHNIVPSSYTTLPHLPGHGKMLSLGKVIQDGKGEARSNELVRKISVLRSQPFSELFTSDDSIRQAVKQIMFLWAGVENLETDSRGPCMDARELVFLEKYLDRPFLQQGRYKEPSLWAANDLRPQFTKLLNKMTALIMVQAEGRRMFLTPERLNHNALWALEKKAAFLPTETEKRIFWVNIVRMLELTTGVTNLDTEDREALILAVKSSDPLLRLDDLIYEAREL